MLLAAAFPERIASAREGARGLFMLSSGDMARLPKDDDLAGEPWIVAANVNAAGDVGRIFLAAPVAPADLRPMVRERDTVVWDMRQGGIVARREVRIGSLLLSSRPIKEQDRRLVADTICQAVRKDGERMLDFSDDAARLQRRVAAVAAWHPELDLPDVSTDAVLERAQEWLPPLLGRAETVAELRKIDIEAALRSMLSYEQMGEVDRLAPERVEMPTGSKIRIDYRQPDEPPVVSVRLQEVFGMRVSPRVDGGRRPVLMELLSPGYKPVQLTQDLESFWSGAYFEVRKELRRRYPRHSWPDDPVAAQAVRGVGRSRRV